MPTPSPRPPDLATGDTLHASDEALGQAPTVASAGRLPLPAFSVSASEAPLATADPADSATMTSGGRVAAPDLATDDARDGATTRRDPAVLPARLDRYHILERIGAGGMGVVFAAYDPDLDRRVAVKLLHADRGGRDSQLRLLREAQALARLSHPNVVQIHDARVLGEQVFIAMEFVRGQDLRTWLSEQERSDSEILRAFLDAGRGLAAAHAEGLVHRDFKPENVLVGLDGRARVADFGLARAGRDDTAEPGRTTAPTSANGPLDVSLTATGAVLGTPAYMSPEQHLGLRADARSDQFSFCVALWEALYRQRPFAGGSLGALILAVQSGQIRPPPETSRVPRRVAELLRRGMSPRPEQRHPDMNVLLAALERDPSRARRRLFAGAALFAMSTGTAFFVADHRASEASACSGGAAELADVWGADRRAAVAAALPDPDPEARVLAGLDAYAARWAASHRDACLDHRRGELSPALFDARVRCLDRRRLALDSAAAVLSAGAPDPAQLVARLPSLPACNDPDGDLSATPWPEDPVLASTFRDIDARLIEARSLYHAGDLDRASALARTAAAEATRLSARPLQAEAQLLIAELSEAASDPVRGSEAAREAAVHAVATRRDDLAAEALARQIFFDGQRGQVDAALAGVPLARAVAERLHDPAAALARLDNNVGTLHLIQRDIDGARPYFERATEAIERSPAGDPLERAYYWANLAVATRPPTDRAAAFERATTLLEGQLGPNHPRVLDLRRRSGMSAIDARRGAEQLDAVCPRLAELNQPLVCGECYDQLAHMRASLGQLEPARAAFSRVDACLEHGALDADRSDQLAVLHDAAAAAAALLDRRSDAALAHADAALARLTPHAAYWWVQAEIAELELARGEALLALDRPDDARAALTRALPVFEDMSRTRTQLLDGVFLARARALLAEPPAP